MKKLVSILIITALLVTAFIVPANATLVDTLYGDMNKDNSVDVLDATEIMRHCAKVAEFQGMYLKIADFDADTTVTVMDATSIQMFNAKQITSPRFNEYLEFYVEIDDINIESFFGTPLLAGKAIKFDIVFDEIFNVAEDGKVCYDYTFRGITDETYLSEYPHDMISYPSVNWSFPSAGIYEISVKVYKKYLSGSYTFTKQFEVLPAYEFDGQRFVSYDHLTNYSSDYPQPPIDAQVVEYESVLNTRYFNVNTHGINSTSDRFVALVHTKEEYDNLFEINNTIYDNEFFEEKSLVVAVSPGYEEYDYSPIEGLRIKDDLLYVDVAYRNNSPYGDFQLPSAPTWYSFVSVDKADVENIKTVQRH